MTFLMKAEFESLYWSGDN